ncbi:MAG: hypothetical protein NC398_11140 [Acetatifactor muris]|nr:hypothetical protein [Acetatifactor muris]
MENRTKNRVKVAISYQDIRDRDAIQAVIKGMFPDTKAKETGLKDGYLHTVLTVPKKPNNTK